MAYGESNGHVIDDVTWSWKVKLVTPIRLELISKTAGDTIYLATIAKSAVRKYGWLSQRRLGFLSYLDLAS